MRTRRGFSMIELMVVVSVMAVLLAVAAPGFRSFLAGQSVKGVAMDLTADLLLARSEALKRNANVLLARRSGDWLQGWTVSVESSAELLADRRELNSSLRFADAPDLIRFDGNGRVVAPTAAVRIGLSSEYGANSSQQRCIELDLSGRARSSVGACP